MDLTNRIALVTGANKGIGFEIATQLAQRGATVLIGGRDPKRVAEAVEKLKAAKLDAHGLTIDVANDESIAAAAATVEQRFDRLDILVNNAGIVGGPGANALPTDTRRSGMREIFETNVYAIVEVTNGFVRLLRKSKHPRIVNMSSEVGSITSLTNPKHPFFRINELAYAASKATVNMVTAMYSKQLASEGFKVNAAIPGWCATELNGFKGPRTPAQGASVAVALATIPDDGPTGTFWGSMAAEDGKNGFPGW